MTSTGRQALRIRRTAERDAAVATLRSAESALGARRTSLEALTDRYSALVRPPALGSTVQADREARRQTLLRHLRGQVEAARAAVAESHQATVLARGRVAAAVQALAGVDVLDAREVALAARERRRRDAAQTEENNQRNRGS